MRKSLLKSAFAVVLVSAAVACSRPAVQRNGLEAWADTTNVVVPEIVVDSTGTLRIPPITSQGFGPVRLGLHPTMLPDTVTGVYDSLTRAIDFFDEEPYFVASGYLRGVHTIEVMAIEDTSRVDAITVLTPAVTANIDGTKVGVGSIVKEIKHLHGVSDIPKTAIEGARLEYRDIRFYVDGDTVCAVAVGSTL